MIKTHWFSRPLPIFIISLLALGSSLGIYISSYVRINDAFSNFVKQHNLGSSQLVDSTAWVNILILSILIALIISGMSFTYVYYRKVNQLYKMQQNFINGFTHELKTPVTSLKLFLDTFSLYDLPRDEQLKYIEFMKSDVKRLSDNTSQILNLAMIEEKEYGPDFVEINFPDYIFDLIKRNSHIFDNINITIHKSTSSSIQGDRHLLEVLIMNLLNNSITYNDNTEIKIIIMVKDIGEKVEISIQDNGVGISKKHKKMIFKKFFRVKRAVKGSGIGLFMAHQITKLHGGNLRVKSPGLGMGSTFYATLRKENYVNWSR